MKKTNEYWVDKDGDMLSCTRYFSPEKTKMKAEPFRARLKMIRIIWMNAGCRFELQDENGKTYSMNDVMLAEYIKKNDLYLDGDWNFYKQGTAFSIGL